MPGAEAVAFPGRSLCQGMACSLPSTVGLEPLCAGRHSSSGPCRLRGGSALSGEAGAPCQATGDVNLAGKIQVYQINYLENTYKINLASRMKSVLSSFFPIPISIFPPTTFWLQLYGELCVRLLHEQLPSSPSPFS